MQLDMVWCLFQPIQTNERTALFFFAEEEEEEKKRKKKEKLALQICRNRNEKVKKKVEE